MFLRLLRHAAGVPTVEEVRGLGFTSADVQLCQLNQSGYTENPDL